MRETPTTSLALADLDDLAVDVFELVDQGLTVQPTTDDARSARSCMSMATVCNM